MKKLTSSFLLILILSFSFVGQTPFDGCPPEGKRKKTPSNPTGKVPVKEQAMNRMKNRDDITGPIDHSVTIQTLIAAKEETDIGLIKAERIKIRERTTGTEKY